MYFATDKQNSSLQPACFLGQVKGLSWDFFQVKNNNEGNGLKEIKRQNQYCIK